MEVKIYQIKDELFENCKYVFMGYDYAKKHGFSLNDYENVYQFLYCLVPSKKNNYKVLIDESDKFEILEKLFEKFNVGDRPANYRGHSLSVSDVVSLGDELYYCNSCGWERIC